MPLTDEQRAHALDQTRRSWNQATRNHNAHKGDQAAKLRAGESTLYPEELSLLGELTGHALVHLQCNAGQDTLSLAQHGARVTGVDLSDEAIRFAQQLALDSSLAGRFVEAEVVTWMNATDARFDVAFASYGWMGWLPDLDAWAAGLRRIVRPGGAFVSVEFHPLIWSIGEDLGLSGDDYFTTEPFKEPVGDYVAASGAGLGGVEGAEAGDNTILAWSYQHGIGELITALAQHDFVIERLVDYPYSNGCRVNPRLVYDAAQRRWHWPEGCVRVPLMFGVRARRA